MNAKPVGDAIQVISQALAEFTDAPKGDEGPVAPELRAAWLRSIAATQAPAVLAALCPDGPVIVWPDGRTEKVEQVGWMLHGGSRIYVQSEQPLAIPCRPVFAPVTEQEGN